MQIFILIEVDAENLGVVVLGCLDRSGWIQEIIVHMRIVLFQPPFEYAW